MDEGQNQGADGRQIRPDCTEGAECRENILIDNEIYDLFSRSGWQLRPFYPADRFMEEEVTTLGGWKSEYPPYNPCFQGSEPSFLVFIISETLADRDSALKQAHAVSWSLGHRVFLVRDHDLIILYDTAIGPEPDSHLKVLASIPYAGLVRFDNGLLEILSTCEEADDNSQDFLYSRQYRVSEPAGCDEALVLLISRLKETISRKIHSHETGLTVENHEKLVIRLLFGVLFNLILYEQYNPDNMRRKTSGHSDPVFLHDATPGRILEEITAGLDATVSAEHIHQITQLVQEVAYEPLILSLVPPRGFSYAFDVLFQPASQKKKKKWIYGNSGKKSEMPVPEGSPGIPDAIIRYCTGRLVMLLNKKKPENGNFPVILDPRCGTGRFLLYLGEAILATAKEPVRGANPGALTARSFPASDTAAEKEKIIDAVYGLEPDAARAESARFVLFLWLNRHVSNGDYLIRQSEAFFSGRHRLFETIRNRQVLYAPDILTDLDRALLGPERAGKIHTFDMDREFPEISQRGGFDAITGNFMTSSRRLPRYIREYLQGHYASYDPGADCSVYLLEKSVALLKKSGICSAVHDCGWTGASFAGRLRNFISSMQIIEMTEVKNPSRDYVQLQDSGILIFSRDSPSQDTIAAKVRPGSCNEIFRQTHRERNRTQHPGRGTGGWSFRDPRTIRLIHAITRHGIPLERYAMSELYPGINTDSARFFLSEPDKCTVPESLQGNRELIPFIIGETLYAYCPVTTTRFLVVPSLESAVGKTRPGPGPNGAGHADDGCSKCTLPDREELKSITHHIRKYAEMKEKILIPRGMDWPACTFDQAGCIPDESIIFIPHRDLYLLAFLNSTIPKFLINQRTCDGKLKPDTVSLQWLSRLPVPVIDGSDAKESRLQERIILLAERIIRLKAIRVPDRDDRTAREIDSRVRKAEDEINQCFYSIYGFSKNDTEIIGRFCTDCPDHID